MSCQMYATKRSTTKQSHFRHTSCKCLATKLWTTFDSCRNGIFREELEWFVKVSLTWKCSACNRIQHKDGGTGKCVRYFDFVLWNFVQMEEEWNLYPIWYGTLWANITWQFHLDCPMSRAEKVNFTIGHAKNIAVKWTLENMFGMYRNKGFSVQDDGKKVKPWIK